MASNNNDNNDVKLEEQEQLLCSSTFFAGDSIDIDAIDSICIGSGRFLRSVLVPALIEANYHPVIVQTRGRSFLDYTISDNNNNNNSNEDEGTADSSYTWTYEVDTVHYDGKITIDQIPYYGAGTLGSNEGKQDVLNLCASNLSSMPIEENNNNNNNKPFIIGVGVTEAGLSSSSSKAMIDLFDILVALSKNQDLFPSASLSSSSKNDENENEKKKQKLENKKQQQTKICIINTDNVSQNGNVICNYMMELASDNDDMLSFLEDSVVFHNTMVDRITSQRPDDTSNNGLVPRAEPIPAKALVIEDLNDDLPFSFSSSDSNKSLKEKFGVLIRSKPNQLQADIALKLRIANGTHTAIAHVMALCGMTMTDILSDNDSHDSKLLLKYLDSFFYNQILVGITSNSNNTTQELCDVTKEDAIAVYNDWRKRLIHQHFGLSTFFITQNGAAKGGIRFGPTIIDLIQSNKPVTCSTVFALAALIRFLTPYDEKSKAAETTGIYKGWLDNNKIKKLDELKNYTIDDDEDKEDDTDNTDADTIVYADGLSYNLNKGWYKFRCACTVDDDNNLFDALKDQKGFVGGGIVVDGDRQKGMDLARILAIQAGTNRIAHLTKGARQPSNYQYNIHLYLKEKDGGNLSSISHTSQYKVLVKAIATVLGRMVADDGMINILKEMDLDANCETLIDGTLDDADLLSGSRRPLHYKKSSIPNDSHLMKGPLKNDRDTIRSIVFSEVSSAVAIDLHTHLLPPTHGALCLWGIDELLTYHYLVAEYFITAPPSIIPEQFYATSKQQQADIIWKALFIDRSPISEACRGVITVLVTLGLNNEIRNRDLDAVRKFYTSFRNDGIAGAERFSKLVYDKAGVKYAVMTNIPFEPTETQHWRPIPKEYSSNYRSACRVDPLLAGNKNVVETALKAAGYNNTIDGAKQFLHDWCDTMKPEYMMASTPHDFVLPEDKGSTGGMVDNSNKTGVNEDAMKVPFAFTDPVLSSNNNCGGGGESCGGGEELASVIDENSDFLSEVLMKVCEERDIPLALKIGAHRKLNPRLLDAGDGVVAFADGSMLARLCTRFPNVRFLATFLSRTNQHEACVLATKFRNLHLYGCWWFCNNPSIIKEITSMRIEMLGTAFTAQHSDSRVLDQLLYKWPHSRAVIASVLTEEYTKLIESGWSLTRGELRRDIQRLFGSSYEEFMSKSLV